jgi:hypothetical protein
VGYRGKLRERAEARRLRGEGKTMLEIANEVQVSKSSVSRWVRDVPFTPSKRRTGPQRRPHPWHDAKLRNIEQLNVMGRHLVGVLSEESFLVAGAALYAGEGSKRDGQLVFANTDPALVAFFCRWLRHVFVIDEGRLRVRVYLHQGLDLDAAVAFWSGVTGVPVEQFRKGYRAVAKHGIRNNKHEFGCVYVSYGSSEVQRSIMGLIRALLSSTAVSGVAQSVEQRPVKPTAEGSSPSPGASPADVDAHSGSRRPARDQNSPRSARAISSDA